jgi:predicted nucleic acid-binding protein
VNVYLDASLIVALFTNDPLSSRADAFLRSQAPLLIVSDFAAAEFASAVARRARTGEMTRPDARLAFSNFDTWAARAIQRVEVSSSDVRSAEAFLRRLDLTLRTPDALNIAIAQRVGVILATFDDKMVAAARKLGTAVAEL